MIDSPTVALRNAMAEIGLTPETIIWSEKWERSKVVGDRGRDKNGNGSYKAWNQEPRGAFFKNWRTGVEGTWSQRADSGEKISDETKRLWAAERKLREEKEKRKAARAAKRYAKVWDNASPADPAHPYLAEKGLTVAPGIRQVGTSLIVPMKSFDSGNPISTLQIIRKGGFKRFARGGKPSGTRMTIGADKKTDVGPIYLCEGYATAVSIYLAVQMPVVVCFSTNNLMAVAKEMRKRCPRNRLIFAADNDFWSAAPKGRNPGLYYAQEAAKAIDAEVAVPHFHDACENPDCDKQCGGKHPTDFDDLRQAEGLESVMLWLNPNVGEDSAPSPAPTELWPEEASDPEAEPAQETEEDDSWRDSAPFRCLGYNHGVYYYQPKGTGQISSLTPGAHDRKTLLPLAPYSWWEHTFQCRRGVDWTMAADAMFRASEHAGVFSPSRVRGRGAWPEDDPDGNSGFLLHLGDRMVVPGSKKYAQPDTYKSPRKYMYERQPRLDGPSNDPMGVEEAREVLALFRDLLWTEAASGDLLAGWTVLAPVCGALDWRPHVFMHGDRGSGKSTVLEHLVAPLLASMYLPVVGNTSEAGIRQALRSDAFPVTFDEAESTDGGRSVQKVLGLARQASSETTARTLKGTQHGDALQYRIRSMFCFAAIASAVYQESDKSRVSLLNLMGATQVSPEEKKAHWDAYQPRLIKTIDEATGRRLIARTLKLLRSGMLTETVNIFRVETGVKMKDQRLGDQYGTLYAGSWLLQSDEAPDSREVRDVLGTDDLQSYRDDQMPEGRKAMGILLQQRERIDQETYAVGEMIDACVETVTTKLDESKAATVLRQLGIKVENTGDEGYMILVANNSAWVRKVLENTMYANGIAPILATLPGAQKRNTTHFHTGLYSRAVAIPLTSLQEK